MSDSTNRSGHVWRWQDEDPEAIVLLVLILVAIIALPWKGCGLGATQGDARDVGHAVGPHIHDTLEPDDGGTEAAESGEEQAGAPTQEGAEAAPPTNAQ